MKSRIDVNAGRVLLLIKLDATSLFNRIKSRKLEYLNVFAIKRTREHFSKIFTNRYRDVKIEQLQLCPEECILSIDKFYNFALGIEWYFSCTEDMPNTVEDKLNRWLHELETYFATMNLYIDAELGYSDEVIESSDDSMEDTFEIQNLEDIPFD